MSSYHEISEFYDAENVDVDFLAHDVPFFLANITGESLDVIELGCGTGRAAVPIAQAGHRVVGLDIDPKMLLLAEQRRAAAGLSNERLMLLEEDISDDWTQAAGGVEVADVVCCFFNTFLVLSDAEDQESCLRAARAALRPGGVLWLDVFNPDIMLIASAIEGEDELEPSLFLTPDGRSVMWMTSLYADVARQVQHVTFIYKWFEDGVQKQRERGFAMTWIMPREMERMLRMCGFRIESTWGDYDATPIEDGSPRQIVKAVRV